jgi:hypothetical protein
MADKHYESSSDYTSTPLSKLGPKDPGAVIKSCSLKKMSYSIGLLPAGA